ncbi:hypothetical protein Tco_0450412 [Tanacetum coccineum]
MEVIWLRLEDDGVCSWCLLVEQRRTREGMPNFGCYDNENGEALKKCITEGPYESSNVVIPAQPTIDNCPAVKEQTVLEDLSNISAENKAHYEAKKEAIHLLLTGIGD